MWAQYASTLVGLWLMAAPTVLDYSGSAQSNDRIIGPVIVSLSVIAISQVTRGVRWGVIPLGVWLLVAPWLLGYDTTQTINSSVTGLLLLVLAPIGGTVERQFGGGWRTLLPGRHPARQ